jgi:hypothetical protein
MKNENILQSFNLALKQHSKSVQHKSFVCSCRSIRTQPFYVAEIEKACSSLFAREMRVKNFSESDDIDFLLSFSSIKTLFNVSFPHAHILT